MGPLLRSQGAELGCVEDRMDAKGSRQLEPVGDMVAAVGNAVGSNEM